MSVGLASAVSTKVFSINKQNELRIDVPSEVDRNFGTPSVTLIKGTAEIFGQELAERQRVELIAGSSIAVFTWDGCEIETEGQIHAYTAPDTPMPQYAKVHSLLEKHRSSAVAYSGGSASSSSSAASSGRFAQGPRVVIVGPVDYGKSTLCRILANWAVRMERTPIFVDLDVGQGQISIPGVLAAIRLYRPFDEKTLAAPLAMFVGSASPADNVDLFKQQVENLLTIINRRLASDSNARSSGLIVNTCGFIDGVGYELLVHSINACRATHVLVIDHDRLFSDLKKQFASTDMSILKVRKSGGVISRDRTQRRSARNSRFREYFYGPAGDLGPSSITLDASKVQIFQLLGNSEVLGSALPIGAERESTRLVPTEPCNELVHSIVAVSYAEERDKILSTNIAGYIYVTEVSPDQTRIKCLAPCPGDLPGKMLIFGNLKFFDME